MAPERLPEPRLPSPSRDRNVIATAFAGPRDRGPLFPSSAPDSDGHTRAAAMYGIRLEARGFGHCRLAFTPPEHEKGLPSRGCGAVQLHLNPGGLPAPVSARMCRSAPRWCRTSASTRVGCEARHHTLIVTSPRPAHRARGSWGPACRGREPLRKRARTRRPRDESRPCRDRW